MDALILFDGHCGLCDVAVRWLLQHDREGRLFFASNDSAAARQILARHQANPERTVIFVQSPFVPQERILVRSRAVLAALEQLPAPWPRIAAVLHFVPHLLLDLVYRAVANSRHRFFRRYDVCPLPDEQDRGRFLA